MESPQHLRICVSPIVTPTKHLSCGEPVASSSFLSQFLELPNQRRSRPLIQIKTRSGKTVGNVGTGSAKAVSAKTSPECLKEANLIKSEKTESPSTARTAETSVSDNSRSATPDDMASLDDISEMRKLYPKKRLPNHKVIQAPILENTDDISIKTQCGLMKKTFTRCHR